MNRTFLNTTFAKIALVLFIGLGATGCTNMKEPPPKSTETAATLPVISQLPKASDTAAFSLALLSRIEPTRTPIKPATAAKLTNNRQLLIIRHQAKVEIERAASEVIQ